MDTINSNRLPNLLGDPVSRRAALRGLGGAGIGAAAGATRLGRAVATETVAAMPGIEPEAGTWRTWLLSNGDQLRPSAPPDSAVTRGELANLTAMAGERDAEVLDRIAFWDTGSPGYRWNEIAIQHTLAAGMGTPAYRVMALLNAAIFDATVAAWDAKYAYGRTRPAVAEPALTTAVATPASPSYPCEHAVTAGAAAAVLSHLFPDAADALSDLAAAAADSRVQAGVSYPSDVAAGLELGRKVGALFIDYAQSDGSDAEFDPATMPSGEGFWNGDPATAITPTMGSWQTWILSSGDQFRSVPPPAADSVQRAAELDEVRSYQRDAHPFTELFFWPQDPAGRSEPDTVPFSSNQAVFYYAPVIHVLWGPELMQKLFEYRLDTNPPRAARAFALVSIACYDATVACWEGKYFYWTARPNQFDPDLTTIIPTYPIPDYPSGHSTGLSATAEVLAYLFPRDARFFRSRAEENAASRLWAGIHFRSACEAGLELGRAVGQAVIDRATDDGAD